MYGLVEIISHTKRYVTIVHCLKIIYNIQSCPFRRKAMDAFELAQLISKRQEGNKPYLEFLKVPDISMGLYVLPAGGVDLQSPHTEDEVYYVVSGRAQIQVADEARFVQTGSIVYVAKNVEHRFHSIEEELTVIVFFAPAEYSNKE
jgi:mannose-6-phosphate isomerase-like protein (cupin superfamily)